MVEKTEQEITEMVEPEKEEAPSVAPKASKSSKTPKVPEGYEARTIVLPKHYWNVMERFAKRGGQSLTPSEWLERYLKHFARK